MHALLLAVVTVMGPDSIAEALNGTGPGPDAYVLSASDSSVVMITTPFARVAMIAAAARKEYRTIGAGDIQQDLLAPTFDVHVTRADRRERVTHVVVMRDGDAVQPIAKEPTRSGLTATFPLSELRENAELRILVDDREERLLITKPFLDRIR